MSLSFIGALAMDPLNHWFLIALATFLLVVFQRHGAIPLVSILVAYMGLVLFSPLPGWLLNSLENDYQAIINAKEKPAVVVLSGGIVKYNRQKNQFFWGSSSDRYLEAIAAFRATSSFFVFSGVAPSEDQELGDQPEAVAMQMRSLADGLPAERIIVDAQSKTTWENAQYVTEILRQKGISEFYLVTSAYHMTRAMASFEYFGNQPTAYPVDFQGSVGLRQLAMSNLSRYRLAMHEYLGFVYYKLKMLFDSRSEASEEKS